MCRSDMNSATADVLKKELTSPLDSAHSPVGFEGNLAHCAVPAAVHILLKPFCWLPGRTLSPQLDAARARFLNNL
jgi:hypothetical protein